MSGETLVMTGLCSLIAPSHITVPAFPPCGLGGVNPSCSFSSHLQSASAVLHPSHFRREAASGREALRKSARVAAIHILAVKTQQAAALLPKVPPFATNCLKVVLLRR